MTTDARRRRLSLLAAQDLARVGGSPRSVATIVSDVGFWIVYGRVMGFLVYLALGTRS